MHTLSSTARAVAVAAAVALASWGSPSWAQTLPQSVPSPDWAAFSPDAGAASGASGGAPGGASGPGGAPISPPPLPPDSTRPAEGVPLTGPSTLGDAGGPAADAGSTPAEGATPAPLLVQPMGLSSMPEADGGAEVAASSQVQAAVLRTPGSAGLTAGSPLAVRLTSDLDGPVGVYKVQAAEAGIAGVLRFGLSGALFSKNDFIVFNNNATQEVGTLTLGFSPVNFFDIYAGTRVTATNSTGSRGTDPNFISELGDFWGGFKFGGFVAKGFGLGLDLRGAAYSGVGTNGLGAGAFLPTGIATLDFTDLSRAPLRLHLNIGGRFGNLNNLGVGNGAGGTLPLGAPEQFALNATAYDSELRGGFAIEVPLPYLTLFAEYNLILPTGTGSLVGPVVKLPDGKTGGLPVSLGEALPHDIDFGVRLTAFKDVSILVGGDIALATKVAIGVPILPEYQMFAGITYNADLFAENRLTVIERAGKPALPPPPTGSVNGAVLEAQSKTPVAGALLQITGAPGLVASDPSGHFESHALPSGPADLAITREGYLPGSAKALIDAGQPATLEILLERDAKPGSLKISAHSAGKPVAAQVAVDGPAAFSSALTLGADGNGQLAVPAAGSYALALSAPGLVGTSKRVEVAPGGVVEVDVELAAAPKRSALIVTDKRIRLKRQIHFETGKALILPDSSPILEELLGVVLSRNFAKLRVEGHTDNVGGKAKNLKLSQDRADAVMQWLISHGVAADRLEAVGYGDSKPVAPNLTSRGRSLNRRVEFGIL